LLSVTCAFVEKNVAKKTQNVERVILPRDVKRLGFIACSHAFIHKYNEHTDTAKFPLSARLSVRLSLTGIG